MNEKEVFAALKYRIDVDIYGHRRYYNAAGQPHREHGPAVEHTNGSKFWYQNGKLHRTDGAAVEWSNGAKEWWLNGQPVTEAQFNQKVSQNV